MAPTAMSPPYFSREELKQTESTLSLACMMKVAMPRATQGRTTAASRRRAGRRIFKNVFFPRRKASTQMQEMAWERMVAQAAPGTPMPRAKMKMGSRIMLETAPMRTESIPVRAKPWAVMKAFMPRVISTKMVPQA